MLKELLIQLIEKVNKEICSIDMKNLIDDLLDENDLIDNEKVPKWFFILLENLLSETETERTFFEAQDDEGDLSNLIAELEGIINADWNDYGEAVEVDFPNLNMNLCISREGDFYELSKHVKEI